MKKYKLPENYELVISEKFQSFRIKDLDRNVISTKSFFLSELETVINDYESNLKKLKTFGSYLNEDNEIDVILKPGSKFILYYKSERVGKYSTILECVTKIKDLKAWYEEYESLKLKIEALNNHEEVSL
jgi:hypothetical protein